MIDREELTRKFSNLVRKIKEDKRFFGATIVIIILILVLVGSITGNFLLESSDKENELSLTTLELETCQNNLEEYKNTTANLSEQVSILEENISLLAENLNKYKLEKENCESSLENCTKTKDTLSADRDIFKHELEKKIEDYNKLLEDYEEIGENSAKTQCCPLYEYGYKYYTVMENSVLCCQKEDKTYLCGPDAEEFPKDKINKLIC